MTRERTMEEWQQFLEEGYQYHRAASGKPGRPPKLGNDIRYNLFSLSLEKSLMAVLLKNNDMADNHTFTDLLDSVGRHLEVPADLRENIINLEHVQSICNLYEYHREPPTDDVVRRLGRATARIYALAEEACGEERHE